MSRRPALLAFMTWLMVLTGLLGIVAGVFLLTHSNDTRVLDALAISDVSVTAAAIIYIAVGVIWVLMASALRSGSNAARMFIVAMVLFEIGVLVWSFVKLHEAHWRASMWPVVTHGLIAGYLMLDNDVQTFFKQA